MTDNTPSPLAERDYEAIEAAVMETERGRWFLNEFARRNRSADTEMLLRAIDKLETAIKSRTRDDHDQQEVRFDLMEMAATIAQTRRDVAAIAPQDGATSHLTTVASELDVVVSATETATYKILEAAEGVQELATRLREAGVDEELCAALEDHATATFVACDFQDLTGQRIAKVVYVLNYIEERLNSMIDVWGDADMIAARESDEHLDLANSNLQPHVAMSQDAVDTLMSPEEAAAAGRAMAQIAHSRSGDAGDDVAQETPVEARAEEAAGEPAVAPPEVVVDLGEPAADEAAAPEAVDEAAPEVVDEAAPEAGDEAAPEVVDEATPEAGEEATPDDDDEILHLDGTNGDEAAASNDADSADAAGDPQPAGAAYACAPEESERPLSAEDIERLSPEEKTLLFSV